MGSQADAEAFMASPQRISASWRVNFKISKRVEKYLHDSIPVVAGRDAKKRQPSDAEVGEGSMTAETFAWIVFVAN